MTYQELYIQWLETRIQAGGAVDTVNAIIDEYNEPTRKGFDAWLTRTCEVSCSTCGDHFKPDGQSPSQETLCEIHRKPLTRV